VNLFLEVGTEELPSGEVAPAAEALGARVAAAVAELSLGGGSPRIYATPRRLAVHLPDVLERQPDRVVEVRGPSRAHAFGPDGSPTPALLGFSRAQGVAVSELVERPAPGGGSYLFALRREAGQPAAVVLPPALRSAVEGVPFRRSMRWGDGEHRFGRPVAWLVCLLGREVLPLTAFGLEAGRESFGHRFLSPGPVPLGEAGDYVPRLADAHVIADRRARRERVGEEVLAQARRANLTAELPAALWDEVTDLVEFPTGFLCVLPEAAMTLPEPVLRAVLMRHQRVFPLRQPDGRLAAAYAGVRNGDGRRLDVVVRGNERVSRARLEDALFFFRRDLEVALPDRRPLLARIDLGEGLGTALDRAERLQRIVAQVGAGADATAQRAAAMLLNDLTTEMVAEYPDLAGQMGEVYARAAGVDPGQAHLLGEAMRPRTPDDDPPDSHGAALLGAALRVEELTGGFALGRQPTGSEDPYGLRRQAVGLVRLYGAWPDLPELEAYAEAAADAFAWSPERRGEVARMVVAFVVQRLERQLVESGVAPQVAAAVCHTRRAGVATARARAEALAAFLSRPESQALLTVHRRAAHLAAAEAVPDDPPAVALPAGPERDLYQALTALAEARRDALARQDFSAHLAAVAALEPALDQFLSGVRVMDPDPEARRRRLGLLAWATALMDGTADLGRVGRADVGAEGEAAGA
jgi:glycyl-tRNA synthetase beta chain